MRHFIRLIATAFALSMAANPVQADTYPSNPVTIIVPYAAGGVTDLVARLFAQKLGAPMNTSFIVENKAVQSLAAAHEVQLVNYLTATGIEIGLLLNFGGNRLEFKRKYRSFRPKEPGVGGPEQETGCKG